MEKDFTIFLSKNKNKAFENVLDYYEKNIHIIEPFNFGKNNHIYYEIFEEIDLEKYEYETYDHIHDIVDEIIEDKKIKEKEEIKEEDQQEIEENMNKWLEKYFFVCNISGDCQHEWDSYKILGKNKKNIEEYLNRLFK